MTALDRSALRLLFRTRLLTVTGMTAAKLFAEGRPRPRPDTGSSDVADSTWVRETLLVASEDQNSTGLIQSDGQLAYDVFVPAGRGTEHVESFSQLVAEAFPPATSLVGATLCAQLYRTTRLVGQSDDPWYFVPVRVWWRVFTPNP